MDVIFKSEDYRVALRKAVSARKKFSNVKVSFQMMADHCRVQKTYLSKVLNKGGNLSRDQLYLAGEYLALNEAEKDFLLLLHDLEGTYVQERQKKLREKILEMRAEYMKTESHVPAPAAKISIQDYSAYYLDPLLQVVHMLMTIPKYSNDLKLLARTLDLKDIELKNKINKLEKLKIIETLGSGYKVHSREIHLSANDDVYPAYRQLVRLLAIKKTESLDSQKSYGFSVIFSTTPEIRSEIQESFLAFLGKVKRLVSSGEEREVYQMNFDLFDWT